MELNELLSSRTYKSFYTGQNLMFNFSRQQIVWRTDPQQIHWLFVAKGFQTHWKESFAHLMLNKAKLKIFPWISTRQKGTNHHKPMLLFVCSVELKMYKTNQSQYLYAVVLKVYKHILYSILSINQPHDSKRWNCKSFVESLQQACSGPWRPNRRNRNCGPRSYVSY